MEPAQGRDLTLQVGTSQVRAHYHDLGPADGAPVLFAHTGGAAVSAWMCWYPTLAAFAAAGYRVLAPDNVSFGQTVVVDGGPVTGPAFLLAFLDAMGVGRAHLLGNSGGGMALVTLASEHPERVRSLVLSGGEPRVATPAAAAITPRLGRTARMDLVRTVLSKPEVTLEDMRVTSTAFFCNPAHPEVDTVARLRLDTIRLPGAQERDRKAAFAQIEGGRATTSDAVFRRIQAPTLLLHGRDEPGFYAAEDEGPLLEAALAVVRLIPRCDALVLAGCGHWPQIEMAERYNQECLRFLAAAAG